MDCPKCGGWMRDPRGGVWFGSVHAAGGNSSDAKGGMMDGFEKLDKAVAELKAELWAALPRILRTMQVVLLVCMFIVVAVNDDNRVLVVTGSCVGLLMAEWIIEQLRKSK